MAKMTDLKKHRILKLLSDEYNNKSYSGNDYTEEGKSLSVEDIHRKTTINLDELNLILKALQYNDYVKFTHLHDGKGLTYYYITDKGRDALLDKRFVWYSLSFDKTLKILPIIISLIALYLSIFKK